MPAPIRWRDLSKTTKSGLYIPQYRLTVPGTNTELVLSAAPRPENSSEPLRWTVRCTACRMPETTVIAKSTDIGVIQTETIRTVRMYLEEQKSLVETMLGALPAPAAKVKKNTAAAAEQTTAAVPAPEEPSKTPARGRRKTAK